MKPDLRDPRDRHGPLSQWLEPAIDEQRISRAWQRIRSAQVSARPRRSWRWLAVPAALSLAAALWLSWLRPAGSDEALRAVDEEVSLAAGAEVPYVADVIPLRDGSRLILEESAQLQVLENDGGRFVASLRRGTARLAVASGPRRWTIETELATIEVIAAIVTIAHHEHTVQVSVERGVVMVRGERVPGRVARLTDGQKIAVRAEAATTPLPQPGPTEPWPAPLPAPATTPSALPQALPSAPPQVPPSASPPASPQVPPQVPPPALPSAATPAVVGPRRALGASSPAPPAASQASAPPDEPRSLLDAAPGPVPPLSAPSQSIAFTSTAKALRDADQLRRSGDAEAAAALLEDARRQRPDDPASGMVEYSLGRLYLNHLGDPGRAARVFTAVIDRGTPQPLIEGAMALRCEALWRSGDRVAARAALAEYQQRYPNGSRLAGLTELLAEP